MSRSRFRSGEWGMRNGVCGVGNRECGRWNGEGGNRDPAYRRRILEYGLLILAPMMLLGSITTAQAMSGREVYDRVHEVAKKTLDHKLEAAMLLFDKGGGTRSRILVAYGRKADGEAYKVLVLFKTPWAYFPEFKKIRRIPTSSQDDSFFGTDFSYDDFGGPANLDDYSFKILREEIMDGKPCYVMEVIPKIRRKYTRYVSWVAKDLWIHLRIEYYQDKDLYRAGSFTDVRMIDDIPTAFKGLMANMKTGHKTEFTLDEVQYHTSFPDDLFTQRSLERAGK
jgi:hypothetical protein